MIKKIQINEQNAHYYSDDFRKGFECGAERQYEADKKALAKHKTGKLIDADALIRSLEVDPVECPGCPEPEYLKEFIELLAEAPTIMPAEEEQ